MQRCYWISLDVHSRTCEYATATPGGRLIDRGSVTTTIPPILEVIGKVRRPRVVVFEEGPLADWLYRNLQPDVDEVKICDPRRNHLIAKDGDKDDPIDAWKLLELARGGYIRLVHHPSSAKRAIFKSHVALYHNRVRHGVAEGLRVIWYFRRYGIVVCQTAFDDVADRPELLDQLPRSRVVQDDLQLLLESFDLAQKHVRQMRRSVIKLARPIEMVRKFTQVPGVRWIRAATFYAYIDTPFRFKTKQALWKYMGIGLQRRKSGAGFERLNVPRACNYVLKDMILGAALSAAHAKNTPFADQYERCVYDGYSPRIARRNVARSLAAVMWGMFKNHGDYRPDWVGLPAKT